MLKSIKHHNIKNTLSCINKTCLIAPKPLRINILKYIFLPE